MTDSPNQYFIQNTIASAPVRFIRELYIFLVVRNLLRLQCEQHSVTKGTYDEHETVMQRLFLAPKTSMARAAR